jgi:hypothetical protein
VVAPGLAACATQQGMTVDTSAVVNASPKYRNAIAVRSVTGGHMMNAMTVMGVENEPLKAALQPVGADRVRIANERAMQENIRQFLLALR